MAKNTSPALDLAMRDILRDNLKAAKDKPLIKRPKRKEKNDHKQTNS